MKHGTPTGYRMHQRHHETPCLECASAKQAADAEYISRPEVRAHRRITLKAKRQALTALAHRYPEAYARLYAKAVEEIRAEEESQDAKTTQDR